MLIKKRNDGEQAWAAFEAEALPHADRLFRLAMWLERNRAEGSNCRAWLVTILHHVRSNRRRASGRLALVPDVDDRIASTTAFVPSIPEKVTDDDLLTALRTIPDQYQQVIVLCDVEEMTYKEISQALDIPMGTVMSRLHRGRTLLRAQLTHGEQQRGRSHHGMP
jgi:RNA polymerase sigma-70 factor (ECF subfamily)